MAELSSDELFLVNDIGDRFEAIWQRGGCPRIEDFLATQRGPVRRALLKHLLCIELELLRNVGIEAYLEDYEHRFREDRSVVVLAFAEDLDSACEGPEDPIPRPRNGDADHGLGMTGRTTYDA